MLELYKILRKILAYRLPWIYLAWPPHQSIVRHDDEEESRDKAECVELHCFCYERLAPLIFIVCLVNEIDINRLQSKHRTIGITNQLGSTY